jgi:hypothetical protein
MAHAPWNVPVGVGNRTCQDSFITFSASYGRDVWHDDQRHFSDCPSWATARVISAGSVVSRNRVMSANRVSFVPPSYSAGYGGIDLFGGPFSFINMNPFVGLMRAVDSNAAGYAFQLAINAICPDCGNVMSDLQKEGAATQPDVLPLLPVGPRSGQRRGECVARQGAERHEDAHHRLFQGRDRRVRGVDQLQQRRTHSQPGMKRQISVSW